MVWANSLGISEASAAILSALPFVGSLVATMFSIETFTEYMNKSNFNFGILQRCLNLCIDVNHTLFLWPFLFIYLISLLSFGIVENFIWALCKFSLLITVVVQCGIYLTYYKLHGQYSSLKRQLTISWGIYAAGVGVVFNLLVFIALFGYSSNMKFIGLCFMALVVGTFFNYVFYVVQVQKFSDEEEAILFVVHVIKGTFFLFFILLFQYCLSRSEYVTE
jgi:hypothetical protein